MIKNEAVLSPCNFFKHNSRYVWNRIAFARRANLRISETSITEELLYQFYDSFFKRSMPVKLFESKEENRTGSHIEVLVKTVDGYVLLACQAKITYKTGNYGAFHHQVGGKWQIDLLQAYAAKHGGIAQYLFYNFMPSIKLGESLSQLYEEDEISDYGITYLSAYHILKWMESYKKDGEKIPTPGFNHFHPNLAKPFHELICSLLKKEETLFYSFPESVTSGLKYYQENEVYDEKRWLQVTRLGQIGYAYTDKMFLRDDELKSSIVKREKTLKPFAPKFRLVVDAVPQQSGLYRIS